MIGESYRMILAAGKMRQSQSEIFSCVLASSFS